MIIEGVKSVGYYSDIFGAVDDVDYILDEIGQQDTSLSMSYLIDTKKRL